MKSFKRYCIINDFMHIKVSKYLLLHKYVSDYFKVSNSIRASDPMSIEKKTYYLNQWGHTRECVIVLYYMQPTVVEPLNTF